MKNILARNNLPQFKEVHRLHFSPTKLHEIFPQVSSQCVKCQCEEGTLLRRFLLCHKTQSFSDSLFDFLSKAFENPCRPTAISIILGMANPVEVRFRISAILES